MVERNVIREKIEAGEHALGARTIAASPVVIDIFGGLGLDFVWLDTEHTGHSPYDSVAFNQLVRATKSAGIEPFVRLADPDPAMVRNMLDAGVETLLLPRIKTAEQLREAVRAAHYTYESEAGERGIGSSKANNWGRNIAEYPQQADNSVLVGALIETVDAVENIDEILAVPKLGFVFLGPVDLSISIGRPMELDHPEVKAALKEVRTACEETGIPVGEMANNETEAAEAIENGAKIVRVGDDTRIIRETLSGRLTELESLLDR